MAGQAERDASNIGCSRIGDRLSRIVAPVARDLPFACNGRKIVRLMLDSDAVEQLAGIGRRFDARNWVLGTSGNFSVVIGREPLRLLMTRSGIAKGALDADGLVEIDVSGTSLRPQVGTPSAEARLHVEIATARAAGAVLHTHSIWSTVLSDRHATAGGIA